MQRPTILFFAGAFADPSCFDTLSEHLRKAGYPTTYAYVPSLNPTDLTTVSCSQDAQVTRKNHILPLLDEGKDVVIFAHSYGGVVGGAAAAGLSKASRSAAGKLGGVIGLLYCVGNIVSEGETLLQAVGGAYPPFIKQDQPSKGVAVISPVIETLYSPNPVPPELVPQLEAAMTPTALAAFETPESAPAWAESTFDGHRAYIRTVNDQCNPSFLQDMWIKKSGVKWDVVNMTSGHCPFITQPEEVNEVAIQVIRNWT
ncbi:prolyl aminopeptidase-like protein [Polyplosphaeria fusca]|uniref:Prolyl aminopeptidase-like protein n=1 Tax=Polyplosphaeria fusca TaxID=682080 RepID=A0A9P4QHE5_9PLEO|nr:prolyl aminopeptidase-like protein [Polyplosphaeria fusca]